MSDSSDTEIRHSGGSLDDKTRRELAALNEYVDTEAVLDSEDIDAMRGLLLVTLLEKLEDGDVE